MAGVGTAWRKHHQVALHESTSTSRQQVRRVSSSSGSPERNASGGWRPRSVRQRLSGQRLSEQRLSEKFQRLRPGLVLPLLRVFRKTGRDAGDRLTHGVAIARLAMSECSGLPLPGGRGSASLPHMLHVRQGSCAWDTAAQSLKLCMTCSELESVMMLVDSCMNHGS